MPVKKATSNNTKIVLFDAQCKLCHAWSRFIIRRDKSRIFHLCSVQSPAGQQLLQSIQLATDSFSTMVYFEQGDSYTKSTAFIKVIRQFGWLYQAFILLYLIPKPLRDWTYDKIALNRYRWFGKFDSCDLPIADYSGRFVNDLSEIHS